MNTCPKCGKELIERVNKHTGEIFVGCTGFPNCKFSKSAITGQSKQDYIKQPVRQMNKEESNEFDSWARKGLASCLTLPTEVPRWLTRTWEADLADEDYEETVDLEQICHD